MNKQLVSDLVSPQVSKDQCLPQEWLTLPKVVLCLDLHYFLDPTLICSLEEAYTDLVNR